MWGCEMRKKRKILFAIRGILAIIIVVLFLLCAISKLASNTVINNIEAATNNMFIEVTNNAMGKVLSNIQFNYEDLAQITTDKNGNVIAVSCNTIKLIEIKTLFDRTIQEIISSKPKIEFSISVGGFLWGDLFSGRGPKIPFELSYDCATKTEFKSEFVSVGINQTIHRIILDLSANIEAIVHLETENSTINTSYILAETIIVGNVPSSYTTLDLNKNSN